MSCSFHLKHTLWRVGASLVIIGYQAKGTTGRKIVEGAKQVRLFRENVTVKAKVFTIGGFSAHADQEDLMEWVGHFESKPQVFLVHGEVHACEALGKKIKEKFHFTVHIPSWKEQLILKPRTVAIEKPGAEEPVTDLQTDLLNTILDLENELKELKKRVKSKSPEEKLGEEEVDRLKYLHEELQALVAEP